MESVMSCNPDFATLVSDMELIVKNHSRCVLAAPAGRLKPRENCKDECYTMKITLDVFVKLHQMLHNYIGLLDFRGSKSRDFSCIKIPRNEALDVAVRAMISTMQSSASKQPSSTPVCRSCARTSECSRNQSVNQENNRDSDKLPEVEVVDKKLLRLKVMTLENVDNVEAYIKDVLHGITKLPLSVMTSRLETLSSVVRNTKNKLTSCGRTSAASLMRPQVNPISDIISEFILEYGQIKSRIYPCRKVCRFCGNTMCRADRERNTFCCENAKRLNFLWKEWTQRNSLKGVAKWDEDTITSIVDSVKGTRAERTKCVSGTQCPTVCRPPGQRDSTPVGQDGEGDNEEKRRGDRNKISADFSQGERHDVRNRREQQDSVASRKIGSLGTGEKRDSEDVGKEDRFGGNQKQEKGKRRESDAHGSNIRSAGEDGVRKRSDLDKTASRKKGLKKDTGGVDLNDQDEDIPGVNGRKKDTGSRKGDRRSNTEEGPKPENKRRGSKSNRKKEGEFFGHSRDQKIGNTGEPSVVKSPKKGREAKKDDKDGQETADGTSPRRGNGNDAVESSGPEIVRLGQKDGGISPGTITRQKYGEADGKPSSTGEERGVKSSDVTHGDSGNVIHYRLSNELFIELGWTLIPKDTIMRRVVEFQALLAKPHLNWFINNRTHGKQYYTDEKTVFMNFLEDGSGHVYYPDGQTAIAAQISKKGTHEIYKVYALGGRDVVGVVRLPWLMGVFDSMGNGVVYDENCDVRLTYNQNGGVYVDNPTKVPFSWGWNNFQTFPIDEAVYEEPSADQLPPELIPSREVKNTSRKASKQSKSSKATSSGKLSEDRDAVESQKSRPVEPVTVIPHKVKITPLKPICLKMNKYLSLRVLDRKNINLQFFAGPRCVRIELGTEVDPNVQINSELVDRDDWTKKMTKSRFHVDVNETKSDPFSPGNSLLEIAKEFQHAKNEANSRHSMIAKYRPNLISKSSHP